MKPSVPRIDWLSDWRCLGGCGIILSRKFDICLFCLPDGPPPDPSTIQHFNCRCDKEAGE